MTPRLQLQLGDLTSMPVECVVNSTDETMTSGGPVHKAIHMAAGPGLAVECQPLAPCPPGEVRITSGHALAAASIIHTVAPTWHGGGAGEMELLASCYRNALRFAKARGIHSLAFPSIGSGLQPQIPLDAAAPVAIRTILDFLAKNELPERVVLVCYDVASFQVHQRALKAALP